MIYLLFQEDDARNPTLVAAYEGPEGLSLQRGDFSMSLGLRAPPQWSMEEHGGDPQAFWREIQQWKADQAALFQQKGITDIQGAHRQWLDEHPSVRPVDFVEIEG